MSTLERITSRKARIGIIGLGYVGLPLAVEFAHAGFDVTGFDVDERKNTAINAGESYIPDVPAAEIAAEFSGKANMGRPGTEELFCSASCFSIPLFSSKNV